MACYCNTPILLAYTSPVQTVEAAGLVVYNTNKVQTCKAVQHVAGTSTVTMAKSGMYYVTVNMDIEPVATGSITVQLNNNNVAIPDAVTTISGTTGTITHITLNTIIQVLPSCCAVNNTANLTVSVSAESTIQNTNIIVEKIA